MLQNVDHIAICVLDLDTAAEFFKKLGFVEESRRTDQQSGAVLLRLPGESQLLFELTKLRGTETPGFNHVAFKVENCAVEAAELKAKGILFDREPHFVQASGRIIAVMRDPTGLRFQLTE